jgi:hypothetical protein
MSSPTLPSPARRRARVTRYGAVAVAASLALVAACGGDDDEAVTAVAPVDTELATTDPEVTSSDAIVEPVGVLAGVCPDPVVIQTDWFPESEHGAMYELIGDGAEIDVADRIVRGPLVASGVDTGVTVEVRSGGPAIGFQPVSALMYAESDITLGYVSTDSAVLSAEATPTLAVVAPLEKNPQIIQWDPATYPDVTSIADLGELGVPINVFAGGTFTEVFVNEGILSADQIDPSYDGSPARFIADDGATAQQGFASESPYSYEVIFEEWSRPIAFELVHDAGLEVYSQALAIRTGDLDELTPCLEQLVPIVQQAAVDFSTDPSSTNELIVETVKAFADFWVYPIELAEFSVDTMRDLGLTGNGPDDVIGNFELDRVQAVIDQMTSAGMSVPEGLSPDQIVTNAFIDPSIGFD